MTSDDTEARRTAEKLRRRERQARQPEAALDPATLAAIIEKHEATVERIVARAETALVERIDTLANAQGATAESVRREIERGLKSGAGAEETATLVRRFGEEQRAAAKDLAASMREGLSALTQSLDAREGAVFAGIDRVAEKVTPGAEALGELRHAVAGATAVARDVAAIRDAAAGSRRALDEAAALREAVADSTRAMNDVAAMRPVLGSVAATHGTWSRVARRWFWLASILLVVFGIACGTAGVALQRQTAIWPPLPEVENRQRDAFWERHGEQVMHCYEVARAHDRGVWCPIIDLDP